MAPAPMFAVKWLVILLALVVAVAVAGIVLWLVLRKKPQPRGFDVVLPQRGKGA